MNEGLTDADLMEKARRNLRRVFREAGLHGEELLRAESLRARAAEAARGPDLQLARGRAALRQVETAAERLLGEMGDTEGVAGGEAKRT